MLPNTSERGLKETPINSTGNESNNITKRYKRERERERESNDKATKYKRKRPKRNTNKQYRRMRATTKHH